MQAQREPDRDPESEIENKKPIENREEKPSRFSESDFDFEKQIEYLRKLLGEVVEEIGGSVENRVEMLEKMWGHMCNAYANTCIHNSNRAKTYLANLLKDCLCF